MRVWTNFNLHLGFKKKLGRAKKYAPNGTGWILFQRQRVCHEYRASNILGLDSQNLSQYKRNTNCKKAKLAEWNGIDSKLPGRLWEKIESKRRFDLHNVLCMSLQVLQQDKFDKTLKRPCALYRHALRHHCVTCSWFRKCCYLRA